MKYIYIYIHIKLITIIGEWLVDIAHKSGQRFILMTKQPMVRWFPMGCARRTGDNLFLKEGNSTMI